MSQENVELVRRIFDSVSRGDVDGALEPTADDFVMDWSNSIGPARGVYRGKDQVRQLWASYLDAFGLLQWNPQEFIEVDDSRLIVVNRSRMRGRGSGAEVDAVGAQLWKLHAGKAESVTIYQTKAEALAASGLAE